MKILHVIHSLDRRSGGPSHALRGLAGAQHRAGHQVSILATTTQSGEPWHPREVYRKLILSDEALAGIDVHLGDAYGRRGALRRFAYTPACSQWLRGRFLDSALVPDIVHIHGLFSHLSSLAARAAHRNGVPYVLRPAGSLGAECIKRRKTLLKQSYARVVISRDVAGASFVHAASAAESEDVNRVFPDAPVEVIGHGVELPEFISDACRDAYYAKFPKLRSRRVVISVARLHSIKRPELLVEAVAALRRDDPDLVLALAGNDAGHAAFLKNFIDRRALQESVVFLDFVGGPMKDCALQTAAMSATASAHENFGISVVESLANGTPALVTPTVATKTFVEESGAGVIVEPVVADIATGMRRLLEQDRAELKRRARLYAETHLSWAAVVDKLDAAYSQAIAGCLRQGCRA